MKFVVLFFLFASIALADDFKTTKGEEYKGVTVSRVEPDGLMLTTSTGIVKVYFAELPKEIQDKYGYQPARAASFAQQDAERQRAIYEKAQADQRAKTEQVQAEIRAEAQSKRTTTAKVIARANQGLLLKPGILTVSQIVENPFSLRGFIVEVKAIEDVRKQEVKEGVYKVEMSGEKGWLSAEMTASQLDSVATSGRMFIRVKPQEEYNIVVPVEVVGSAVTYEGLSRVPTFYWKH